MRHAGIYAIAMVAFLSLSTVQMANAQPQPNVGPTRSPSFSPYLNLLRNNNGGGGNAVTNYYGIIRPQQQLQQQSGILQQQLSTQNQSIQGLSNGNGDNTVGPITGNGASFGFYSHYFNNFSAGGGGGNRSGGSFGSSGGRSGSMGTNGIGGGNIGQGPRQNFGNAAGGGRGRR